MRVGYNDLALADARKIATRYKKDAGSEVAAKFTAEIDACLSRIFARPETFAVKELNIRTANLHRFPCQILFRLIDDDQIRILAIRHHRRRLRHPRRKYRRPADAKASVSG